MSASKCLSGSRTGTRPVSGYGSRAAPTVRALGGATLHEMMEKPDAGRIVDQEAVAILPDEPAVDVFGKVTAAAERVLRRSLPKLVDGSAVLRAQDLSQGGYYGGRRPEDGRIDWR